MIDTEILRRSLHEFAEVLDSDLELNRHKEDHDRRIASAKLLFQPSRIPELTRGEIEEFLRDTDAFQGVRGKIRLFAELLGPDGDRLAATREVLAELFRRAEIGLTPGDLNEIRPQLRYVGPAFVSEMLALTLPDKYWIWNGQVQAFCETLGIRIQDDLPYGKKADEGEKYFAAGRHLEKLRRDLGEALGRPADYMVTDLFIYWFNQNAEADPWAGRIAAWLREDLPDERMKARLRGEAAARQLLEQKVGRFEKEDLWQFTNDINADWFAGSERNTRFMPGLYGNQVHQMAGALEAFNRWILAIWDADASAAETVLAEFLAAHEVPGAGTSLPTAVLYLKTPSEFNIWIPIMEQGLAVATDYQPGRDRSAQSYRRYNEAVIRFRDRYKLDPQALDIVLWRFAKLPEPDGDSHAFVGFTRDTFSFLKDLARNNTKEWMEANEQANRGRYEMALKEPLRQLFEAVAPSIRSLDPGLETEAKSKKVLAAINKRFSDDEGPYHTYLWGAFYRRGRTKQTDAQLFINVQLDHVNVGLSVAGSKGSDVLSVFRRNLEAEPELFLALLRALPDGIEVMASPKHGSPSKESIELISAHSLKQLEELEVVDIQRRFSENDPILYSPTFASEAAAIFEALFPLYRFVTAEDLEDFPREVLVDTEPEPDGRPLYSLAQLLDATYLDGNFVQQLEALLIDKKQIILMGPPGTGKTWIASRFAQYWVDMAPDPEGEVEVIQFHPSYAYEEFMEGIRPESVKSKEGSYTLTYPVRPGIFRELCDRARGKSGRRYVLIIDEINRGELPRILGELLFLLEYRQEVITLPYSRDTFSIPDNVFIIGTMNTADRSIALVDHALRRRFHFVALRPSPQILRSFHEDKSALDLAWIADLLELTNKNLDDDGIEWHLHVGHSHFMRPDLDEDQLRLVWKHSVMPMLEEYFYRQPERLARYQLDELLSALGVRG